MRMGNGDLESRRSRPQGAAERESIAGYVIFQMRGLVKAQSKRRRLREERVDQEKIG
jgi:hypothetical protein